VCGGGRRAGARRPSGRILSNALQQNAGALDHINNHRCMDELKPRETCNIGDAPDASAYRHFANQSSSQILFVAEQNGRDTGHVLKPDTGDFVKWLKSENPGLPVEVERAKTLVLHSNDVWIPLAFLANDIALPVYLNMVSSYLYSRFKNALKGEKARVHLSAEYADADGAVKRFTFEGDQEALEAAIKKFDLNRFMDG
jgi:hypothetical protein